MYEWLKGEPDNNFTKGTIKYILLYIIFNHQNWRSLVFTEQQRYAENNVENNAKMFISFRFMYFLIHLNTDKLSCDF